MSRCIHVCLIGVTVFLPHNWLVEHHPIAPYSSDPTFSKTSRCYLGRPISLRPTPGGELAAHMSGEEIVIDSTSTPQHLGRLGKEQIIAVPSTVRTFSASLDTGAISLVGCNTRCGAHSSPACWGSARPTLSRKRHIGTLLATAAYACQEPNSIADRVERTKIPLPSQTTASCHTRMHACRAAIPGGQASVQ